MNKWTVITLILFSKAAWSQHDIKTTNEFIVVGKIENEIKIRLTDLEKIKSISLPDVTITNHLGEVKGTAKQLAGILIKDLLKDLKPMADNPKLYSEFYLTFVASDNYKVVYSWNEIFNSPTGNNLYILTAKDGKGLKDMSENIAVLTITDIKTGRRYIKGLSEIVVSRVE